MSRSRKKVAIMGIAYGSNTEFYRAANRKLRTVKKRILKMFLLGRLSEDDISFPAKHKDVGYTDWNEPTDGHPNEFSPCFPKWLLEKMKRK